MISLGLEAGDLGREAGAVAFGDTELAGRNVDPGEREAALFARRARARGRWRADSCCAVASSSVSSVSVPGVTRRDDVAPHDAFAAALPRLGRILDLLADRDAMAERDQAMEIFVGAVRPARRTSGCRGRDACRAW